METNEVLEKTSPEQEALEVAKRFKRCRKNKHLTQEDLAKKSMVPYGTIKLFEQTGKVSFTTLLTLAESLGMLEDIKLIFVPENHRKFEDIINYQNK